MQKIPQTNLKKATNLLKKGIILAIPTETVYGLAVIYDNPTAIQNLLNLKSRTPTKDTKYLTLMLPNPNQIPTFAKVSQKAQTIINENFPGELTLILPKNPNFKNPYFDPHPTIGIRIPNHPYTLKLLTLSGPLLVTSANHRSQPPCITSKEVEKTLPEIPATITGKAGNHPPSTVAKIEKNQIQILRQGTLHL